jgi:hypothetical protein
VHHIHTHDKKLGGKLYWPAQKPPVQVWSVLEDIYMTFGSEAAYEDSRQGETPPMFWMLQVVRWQRKIRPPLWCDTHKEVLQVGLLDFILKKSDLAPVHWTHIIPDTLTK